MFAISPQNTAAIKYVQCVRAMIAPLDPMIIVLYLMRTILMTFLFRISPCVRIVLINYIIRALSAEKE